MELLAGQAVRSRSITKGLDCPRSITNVSLYQVAVGVKGHWIGANSNSALCSLRAGATVLLKVSLKGR